MAYWLNIFFKASIIYESGDEGEIFKDLDDTHTLSFF